LEESKAGPQQGVFYEYNNTAAAVSSPCLYGFLLVLISFSEIRVPEAEEALDDVFMQIDLFQNASDGAGDERVLLGEARVPLTVLLQASENNLLVELSADEIVTASIMLKIRLITNSKKGKKPDILVETCSDVSSLSGLETERPASVGALSMADSPLDEDRRYHSEPDSPSKFDLIERLSLRGSSNSSLNRQLSQLKLEAGEEEPSAPDVQQFMNEGLSQLSDFRPSSPSGLKGLVSFEIVAAQGLPRARRWLRPNSQNNPFVVISFGKQSFRTKVIRRSSGPVWKERLFFPVHDSEAGYYVIFSVYDYDKLSYNVLLASTNLKISSLLERPNEIQKIALSLRAIDKEPSEATLLIKGCFVSYDVLRQNFWHILARPYDHDDNGRLNRLELSTMLASLGSTLSEETLDSLLKAKIEEDGKLSIDNIASALESLTLRTAQPEGQEENVVLVSNCPICGASMQRAQDVDVVTHLAICAAKDARQLDRFVMGGFLTEDYASRKWLGRLLGFMSFGGYRIGKNNAHILVQDRRTGKLSEERMPTYIRMCLRLLHQNTPSNRAVESGPIRQLFHSLTLKQGRRFDDPSSARNIPDFVRYHRINLDEVAEDIASFRTFNEFFYRRLKPDARLVESDDPRVALSPADCRVNAFPSVTEATRLWIKGANFSISALLRDEHLGQYYEGGSLLLCRLAPQDYHRFHAPVDGRLTLFYHIPGSYFTVNPMAVRQRIDVYTENARTVCLLETAHFGKVALVAIGAMMVGSIVLTCRAHGDQPLSRMQEMGYFAFGGSTIVVLFPKGAIRFDEDLVRNSQEQLETLIQVGNSVGRSLL